MGFQRALQKPFLASGVCVLGSVALEVSDDGSGFDPSGSLPGHLGLCSMRERAAQIGGMLESTPGRDTKVMIRIPLQLKATCPALARALPPR